MDDFPFEIYKPDAPLTMAEDEAREISKELVVALIQLVFEHLDPEALVQESKFAAELNADERERIAALVNSAHVEVVMSWE